MKLTALLAALAIFAAGCASTYLPQEPGRVSFILDGPGFALYKDGTKYGAGGLSSEPVRAVAGNPLAEAHARTFVNRSRLFWAIYGVALASLVTAVIVAPKDAGHGERGEVAAGFGIGGIAALFASLIPAATAPGHLYDAVNIYNDGVAKQSRPYGWKRTAEQAVAADDPAAGKSE